MKKLLAILMVVAVVVSVFTLAACGNQNTSSQSTSTNDSSAASDKEAIVSKGKLIVGVTDFEPMDYKNENGEWIGFDADMAKEFAKSLGIDVEIIEIDWDNKVLELNGKSIDCVWNGMTLTDEVTSAMECTDPYMNNGQVVIVNSDVADKYQKPEDCKDLKFAVESGSAGQEMAEANGFNFTEVKDQASALMEVKSKTSDAAIIDLLMASAMVGEGTSYSDLTYTCKLNDEKYGVGFRKGSDMANIFNEWLKQAISDGTVEKIAKEYKVEASLIK